MPAPFALRIWSKRPAAIRSFGPLNSEPPQVLEHRFDEFEAATLRVQIFVAEDELAAALSSTLRRYPKSARMAKMKKPSRRRGESPAIRQHSICVWGCRHFALNKSYLIEVSKEAVSRRADVT